MCNLYSIGEDRVMTAFRARAAADLNNNQPPMAGVYPDYAAPVVIHDGVGGRIMKDMRWGMPTSEFVLKQATDKRADAMRKKGLEVDWKELRRMEPDKGVTNVRNTTSETTGKLNAHWGRWLGQANRCLVPFTSFAEPDQDHTGNRENIWFALDESRPLAFFAGIWTPHACVRMKSKGWEEIEAFAFLTTDSAEPVATYHRKAMPVILTTDEECNQWMEGRGWAEVMHLQRPLPVGTLQVVGRGGKSDDAALRRGAVGA